MYWCFLLWIGVLDYFYQQMLVFVSLAAINIEDKRVLQY